MTNVSAEIVAPRVDMTSHQTWTTGNALGHVKDSTYIFSLASVRLATNFFYKKIKQNIHMNEHPSLSERLNMRSIILTLLLILFPATIFAVNNNKKIFYAEEGGGPLPAAVEALLKRTSPDTANTCGFSGKELLLSNKPNDSHYYAIGPRSGSCIGSGGTTLWVAQLKNKKAAILIENIGTEIIQLETVSHGLHNLKFTGGSTRDFETSEWSYDGSKYQLIKQTNFTPEDCADGTKSKDPDFPWNCEN